jgi:hypothetical protein
MGRLLASIEHAVKKPIWGCRMCGQCVLHNTGMTCPMNCPKSLRNGPCGGVRPDGACEVDPTMRCVWLKAWGRAERLPFHDTTGELSPPVDNRLWGSSSWANLLTGRDRVTPAGWADEDRADEDDSDSAGAPAEIPGRETGPAQPVASPSTRVYGNGAAADTPSAPAAWPAG